MASTLLNELGYNADWIERQLDHCERNGVRAAYSYAEYLPQRPCMVQEFADYLDALRFAFDSAGAEKQTGKPEDVFKEMNTDVAIGKIGDPNYGKGCGLLERGIPGEAASHRL